MRANRILTILLGLLLWEAIEGNNDFELQPRYGETEPNVFRYVENNIGEFRNFIAENAALPRPVPKEFLFKTPSMPTEFMVKHLLPVTVHRQSARYFGLCNPMFGYVNNPQEFPNFVITKQLIVSEMLIRNAYLNYIVPGKVKKIFPTDLLKKLTEDTKRKSHSKLTWAHGNYDELLSKIDPFEYHDYYQPAQNEILPDGQEYSSQFRKVTIKEGIFITNVELISEDGKMFLNVEQYKDFKVTLGIDSRQKEIVHLGSSKEKAHDIGQTYRFEFTNQELQNIDRAITNFPKDAFHVKNGLIPNERRHKNLNYFMRLRNGLSTFEPFRAMLTTAGIQPDTFLTRMYALHIKGVPVKPMLRVLGEIKNTDYLPQELLPPFECGNPRRV